MSEDALPTTGGVLPLDDIGSQDVDLVGRLAEYVDRLDTVTASLRGDKPLEAWVTALLDALDLLADVAPRDDWQMLSARRTLASLVPEPAGPGARTRIGLGDVRSLLHELLAGRPTRASFRTGDLTVCSLAPMRAVPHRVVCVVGLDDGAFPRVGSDDGDDVLARDPLVGERDPRSEDRQILLDAIHAATDTLVLLYTGADPRTNARRPPCVPLGEVLDTLVQISGSPEADSRERARDRFVVRHPLQPFDPRNFVAGRLGVARPFSFDTKALAGAERAGGPRLQPPGLDALRLDPVPADREHALTLDALVNFVEHPVKAFLRKRLGVSVGGGDEDDVDDVLCVALDKLEQWAVATGCSRPAWGEPIPRPQRGPNGLVACSRPVERATRCWPSERCWSTTSSRRSNVQSLPAPATVDVAVPLGDQTLVGSVPGVRGATVVRVIASSLAAKHRLRAWVQLLALTAAQPEQPWTSLVVGRRKDEAVTFRIGPIPTDVAVRNLERLADLHSRGMCMPLPMPTRTSERMPVNGSRARVRVCPTAPHARNGGAATATLTTMPTPWRGAPRPRSTPCGPSTCRAWIPARKGPPSACSRDWSGKTCWPPRQVPHDSRRDRLVPRNAPALRPPRPAAQRHRAAGGFRRNRKDVRDRRTHRPLRRRGRRPPVADAHRHLRSDRHQRDARAGARQARHGSA